MRKIIIRNAPKQDGQEKEGNLITIILNFLRSIKLFFSYIHLEQKILFVYLL